MSQSSSIPTLPPSSLLTIQLAELLLVSRGRDQQHALKTFARQWYGPGAVQIEVRGVGVLTRDPNERDWVSLTGRTVRALSQDGEELPPVLPQDLVEADLSEHPNGLTDADLYRDDDLAPDSGDFIPAPDTYFDTHRERQDVSALDRMSGSRLWREALHALPEGFCFWGTGASPYPDLAQTLLILAQQEGAQ